MTQDPQGVGPPQHWFVLGGTTTPFHYEFGVKGEYGAPRDLDGMVPQVYATWVNGLTPGRYYARAWVFRYVQSTLDGSTFQEYYFDITPQEWAGDVTIPIDLRLSSWINKTVHFHNVINGITDGPDRHGRRHDVRRPRRPELPTRILDLHSLVIQPDLPRLLGQYTVQEAPADGRGTHSRTQPPMQRAQ